MQTLRGYSVSIDTKNLVEETIKALDNLQVEIPQTSDESHAFFARLIIINFPKQFLGDDADPHLIDKLTTKQEISGFFNLIVSRVAKVLKDGITGSNQSLEDNYTRYIESSDPIRAFLETDVGNCRKPTSVVVSRPDLLYSNWELCILMKCIKDRLIVLTDIGRCVSDPLVQYLWIQNVTGKKIVIPRLLLYLRSIYEEQELF